MAFGPSAVARCALLLLSYSAVLGGDALDLTHTFDETTLYCDPSASFKVTAVIPPKHGLAEYEFSATDDGGTLMEAPARFITGGLTIEDFPVSLLVHNKAAVIDMVEQGAQEPNTRLNKAGLDAWKAANGPFVHPTVVLVKTGYANFWPNRTAYFGLDSNDKRHFPGIAEDAARELADDPAVVGVGIDTAGIGGALDVDTSFTVHRIIAAANMYIVENIADISPMPATGGRITVLPMKIGGGVGAAPCRVIVAPEPDETSCPGTGGGHRNSGGHGNGHKHG